MSMLLEELSMTNNINLKIWIPLGLTLVVLGNALRHILHYPECCEYNVRSLSFSHSKKVHEWRSVLSHFILVCYRTLFYIVFGFFYCAFFIILALVWLIATPIHYIKKSINKTQNNIKNNNHESAKLLNNEDSDSEESLPERKKVVIVGGGPSGLIALKEILSNNSEDCDVILYERDDNIGGSFYQSYNNGYLTSSSFVTAYSYMAMEDNNSGYFNGNDQMNGIALTFSEYCEYLDRFCKKYNLYKHIKFNTSVNNINGYKNEETGRIQWDIGTYNNITKVKESDTIDHLIVATGIAHTKRVPVYKGMESFNGNIIHSSELPKDTKEWVNIFKQKNIVMVGLGETGSDICYTVSEYSNNFTILSRNGPGCLIPRYFGGKVADLDTSYCYHYCRSISKGLMIKFKRYLESFWLTPFDDLAILEKASEINDLNKSDPFHKFGTKSVRFVDAMIRNKNVDYVQNEIQEIKGNTLILKDGKTLNNVDTIIMCTGYKSSFEYIKYNNKPNLDGKLTSVKQLFRNCLLPEFGDAICFMGYLRPAVGSLIPLSEMTARYYSCILNKSVPMKSISEMHEIIKADVTLSKKHFPYHWNKIDVLIDFVTYYSKMADLIGCQPKLWEIFIENPFSMWMPIMFGPVQGIHYRIHGPNKFNKNMVKKHLKRIPMMPYPVMVTEFVAYCFVWLTKKLNKEEM